MALAAESRLEKWKLAQRMHFCHPRRLSALFAAKKTHKGLKQTKRRKGRGDKEEERNGKRNYSTEEDERAEKRGIRKRTKEGVE